MRRYETTFIVNPQADDAAIDRQVGAITELIKNQGGEILYENRIGTRRLAYPIAGLVQGFYANIIFNAETSVLDRLERLYKLEEPYLRHLTIRYEGEVPSHDAVAPAGSEQIQRGRSKRSDSPPKPIRSTSVDKTPKPGPAPVEPAEKPAVEPAEKPAVEPAAEPAEKPAVEPAAEPAVDEASEDTGPVEIIKPEADQPDPADEEL